jgi:hypothetical protein
VGYSQKIKKEEKREKTHRTGSVIVYLDVCICTSELRSKNSFYCHVPFLGIAMGNPRVSQLVPVPVPVETPTHAQGYGFFMGKGTGIHGF